MLPSSGPLAHTVGVAVVSDSGLSAWGHDKFEVADRPHSLADCHRTSLWHDRCLASLAHPPAMQSSSRAPGPQTFTATDRCKRWQVLRLLVQQCQARSGESRELLAGRCLKSICFLDFLEVSAGPMPCEAARSSALQCPPRFCISSWTCMKEVGCCCGSGMILADSIILQQALSLAQGSFCINQNCGRPSRGTGWQLCRLCHPDGIARFAGGA